MAKRFGGNKAAAEVVEEVVEEVEVEEEVEEVETPAAVIAKSKKVGIPAKKAAPAEAEEVEEDAEEELESGSGKGKGSNAPRARKWNYGITPEAKIFRMKGAESPKGVVEQWPFAISGSTVQAFYDAGGDRHGLRVMMRNKAIVLKSAAGQFPQPYDHAAAAEAAQARAAAKAAKAAEEAAAAEDEEEVEEVAPTPVKKTVAKAAPVVVKKKK